MAEYEKAMILKLIRDLAEQKAYLEAQIQNLRVRVANLEKNKDKE